MNTPLTKKRYEASSASEALEGQKGGDKENRALDHIPGDDGWPIIGNTVKALVDTVAMARELHAKYGPVVRNNVMGQRYVLLLSPDAVEYVLLDRQRNFSSRLGWRVTAGRFFDGGLMLLDFDVHHAHRQLVQTAFRTAALQEHLARLVLHMDRHISGWDPPSPVHFYPEMKKMALAIAGSAFLGIELESELEVLKRAFVDLVGGTTAIVRRPVPGLSYWRGIRGLKVLQAFYRKHIPARREGAGSDIFSRLCQARSGEGVMLSDDEIVAHLMFIMVAGHATVTSALTMMAYELAGHPEWQDECREEVLRLGQPAPSHDDLKTLERIDWTLREVLRLYPPIPLIPRRTLRECEIGGHRIPANATVIINVGFVQRMPEWWDKPDTFDPLRFAPPRSEQLRHSYSWIPFSGGAHSCLGMYFAFMEVKVFYSLLLRKYQLRLPKGYKMKLRRVPMAHPGDALPLELLRLGLR